ncbi:MAG: 2-dehydropantoate 2-reductase [Rhodomicrobium sp.]|nr:2-dehydropantoate 2-reductase [Rhodomicrobium sp.]
MRIAIMGSGGIGGYFGARLALSGSDVTFIARGRHLAAMREHGLRIESELGDMHLTDVKATDDPAAIGPVDLVIFGVKLWDTEDAARQILPLTQHGAAVVSFQNGVQKDDILRGVLGEAPLIGGVSYIAAYIKEPGVISQTGKMQRLIFGEFDGSRSPRVEAFLKACEAAGIHAELSEDIRRVIWEKFVFLVGLSGSTSTVRLSIGPIREDPQSRAFLADLMREVIAVGRAHGVNLAESFADDRLAFADSLPAAMTSSMHNDLEHGKPLEVPWLSGGVVALGKAVGVPTPCNRAVADILAPHALGRAGA